MCIFKNWNEMNSENEKKALINTILRFLEQSAAAIASVLLERLAGYLLPFTYNSLASVSGFVMSNLDNFMAPSQPGRKERSTITGIAVKVATCT